jgi:DHA2 family multidrug resistance protein
MRNLGSAIGISVTSALLISNTQVNHESIASYVTPFNQALQSGAAAHFWNPMHPAGAAALNGVITRQATIIAYVDDFKLMMIISIMALPLVFALRKPKTAPSTAGHEAIMD